MQILISENKMPEQVYYTVSDELKSKDNINFYFTLFD